jgi:hypothetical protein
MAESKTPAGVDPALWAEFQRLSDTVHELHRQRELEEVTPAPATRRMVLDVSEEWFLLFAWIDGRERRRRQGKDGETGLTAERITDNEHVMRKAVTVYMQTVLNDHFHAELHDLATGASPILRPLPPKAEQPAATSGDLDDDIPF